MFIFIYPTFPPTPPSLPPSLPHLQIRGIGDALLEVPTRRGHKGVHGQLAAVVGRNADLNEDLWREREGRREGGKGGREGG